MGRAGVGGTLHSGRRPDAGAALRDPARCGVGPGVIRAKDGWCCPPSESTTEAGLRRAVWTGRLQHEPHGLCGLRPLATAGRSGSSRVSPGCPDMGGAWLITPLSILFWVPHLPFLPQDAAKPVCESSPRFDGTAPCGLFPSDQAPCQP